MEKLTNLHSVIYDMFCKNKEKRLRAIKNLKSVIFGLKTCEVQDGLLVFLTQFLYEEQSIVTTLLEQLSSLDSTPGGFQFQALLLPLFIKFCQIDEKEVSLKCLPIIEKIVQRDEHLFMETVQQLLLPNMVVSVEIGLMLISRNIQKFGRGENLFLQFYLEALESKEASIRLAASKHLSLLAENVGDKEQMCNLIDTIFGNVQQLPKLLTIKALLIVYAVKPNYSLNKIRALFGVGTWRTDIALCKQCAQFQKYLNRFHFKNIVEPGYVRMLGSDDDEVKAAACETITTLARYMGHQQAFNILFPLIVNLSNASYTVKLGLSKIMLQLIPQFPKQKSADQLIPVIIKFLKENDFQCIEGIVENSKLLLQLMPATVFKQSFLKVVLAEEESQNWRYQVKILDFIDNLIKCPMNQFQEQILEFLKKHLKSRVEALQMKAISVYSHLVQGRSKEWREKNVIPLILQLKKNLNFRVRQKSIVLISEVYKNKDGHFLDQCKRVICSLLDDKVPNIRYMALEILVKNIELRSSEANRSIIRLRSDPDQEIQKTASSFEI